MIYYTEFAIGDRVVLAYPHKVERRVASFPDWETVITECSGIHVVTVNSIAIRSNEDRFLGGITYMFGRATPCQCGRTDIGNCFKEGDKRVVGRENS